MEARQGESELVKAIQTDEGLKYACCAISFFRGRHTKRLRYKKPSSRNANKTVFCYREYARMVRHYIRMAREAGWRGSVKDTVQRLGKEGGDDRD